MHDAYFFWRREAQTAAGTDGEGVLEDSGEGKSAEKEEAGEGEGREGVEGVGLHTRCGKRALSHPKEPWNTQKSRRLTPKRALGKSRVNELPAASYQSL